MITIGVFDSGMGGLSVANAIQRDMPQVRILYANDSQNVPYGTKTPEQLESLTVPILQQMIDGGARIIVIACNTVTTTIIERLRAKLSVPLIGIEPMVKPAVLATKTGIVAVCATPGTLKSERYAWLKRTYAPKTKIIEPDCSNWANMVERNEVNRAAICNQVAQMCTNGADVIVLGCTHYHWIEELIKQAAGPDVTVLQPETAIVARLKTQIAQII